MELMQITQYVENSYSRIVNGTILIFKILNKALLEIVKTPRIMIEDVEINDNEFLRQFELEVGDNMARIEYALQDRKIFLTKYDMPEDMEDQGFRDIFIKAVFQEVEDRGISLVPTSPEIAGFMRKNRRKYKSLLPVGISI